MIRRAIIPAAGHGTRLRPFTLAVPKELAPLAATPAIHWVIEEALEGGLDRICLVLREGKDLVRDYVERARGEGLFSRPFELEVAWQAEPKGLGDAIASARDRAEGEPFALLLPDNVILAPEYRLELLLAPWREEGRDVVGILRLGEEDSGHYGNSGRFEGDEVAEGRFEIRRLADKKAGTTKIPPGETVHRTCGRYVCHPDVFERIEAWRPRVDGELDEVPIYQEIAAERGLIGCLLPRPVFDVGQPVGLLSANAWLAARRREARPQPLKRPGG